MTGHRMTESLSTVQMWRWKAHLISLRLQCVLTGVSKNLESSALNFE
jgi:hypothetical protein